ncbi:MAG: FAD-dependent oxidoreductase [Gemmatimonadetes bacterium]|uniref:FAD-dependent oxidoreductase n=1 Tax=Candidatus Kutchimonas denitrificans TaxID=3056748 RepID=A0AAE4ZA29_9BACT|nr:FAD-dependent oxidoreductase [Gemmatimonadota bacterium]NIR75337.1 FAD-dependent oxidoreductase [Candidatus Kutchimonas denitrificans]NIS00969.1 FAD-dependent oxidoreductase [Gemmatimonadota bacterium]NIT66596.1 FAD-dependent oxidoreductase [Gemmatimonadota bacterium]NIU53166.1 FAD-dependent oxidoreductase [Gemmatimonadota bacterium]
MAKPAILTLDDDVDVLRAVERDLRREYGSEYRVTRADSGASALQLLEELKRRGEPSALMLVDQRMPAMSGVEFLQRAVEIFPESKRVLLTAYADTEAAIRAINEVHIDHYLLKPWDPPEEKLYPVLTDLLDDWRSAYRPPFEGIRVVGSQWAPASHRIKEFLARNNIPYLWMDPEVSKEARRLIEVSGTNKLELPCLFFPDGSMLEKPENREIAERCGLQTSADMPFYDLVVVGAGPAGLAASVYGASEGLRTLVVEKQAPGGQAGMSSRIENYLGFPGGVSGGELARRAVSQARRFGAEVLSAQEAVGLSVDGPSKTVKLGDGSELKCRALLIATGVSYRQLDAEGIERLAGAGVYYGAAMTEGESVRNQDVYIIGGANSAGQAAMYFSGYARTVTMLVRGASLSSNMSQYLIDQIDGADNIQVRTGCEVVEVLGETRLEKLVIAGDGDNTRETVSAAALFIFIGAIPHTEWLGDLVARDERGFVLSGAEAAANGKATQFQLQNRLPFLLETSLPGVFVAGDVRHGSVKRVASAVGEGSMAVMYVHRYLSSV